MKDKKLEQIAENIGRYLTLGGLVVGFAFGLLIGITTGTSIEDMYLWQFIALWAILTFVVLALEHYILEKIRKLEEEFWEIIEK